MIAFDPIAITQALYAGVDALRATVSAPATLFQIDRGPLKVAVAAGVSDFETNTPAVATQTFEIGSQTKLMTSVAILQLVEQGKIDLDAKASTYLSTATIAGIANTDTVTVRQLLNMTSGIANYTEVVDADGIPLFVKALLEHPDQVFGPQQALELARGLPALSAPGEVFSYTNTNYLLLGQIIEQQTGKSFLDVLQAGIFNPANMADTVAQLNTSDPRLSSYLADQTGELVDVTRAQWELRGEAGIASTTEDMSRFLKALFVDKTLLGDAALAELTTFVPTGANEVIDTGFGLGLVKFAFIGGDTYYGFTGGTLGTSSSTYLNINTGEIVAVGATGSEVDTAEGAFNVLQSLDSKLFDITDDGGPLRFISGSANALDLKATSAGLAFALDGATLTLDRVLRATTTASVSFEDGSVLVVGDNKAGIINDNRANTIDIQKQYASAIDKDNQLIGLGGNDVLKGGRGDDKVFGGTGHDKLWGRAGDDILSGGQGRDTMFGGAGKDVLLGGSGRDTMFGGAGKDVLLGGSGRDIMNGGAGADTFAFMSATDSGNGRQRDTILDFQTGIDKIDLHAILAGSGSDALIWRGSAAFTGSEGEIRVQQTKHGDVVMVDLDGNGQSDMDIMVFTNQHLSASDFLF